MRVIFLTFLLMTITVSVSAYSPQWPIGDINGDGRITSADATKLARYLVGHFAPDPGHVSHTAEWRRIADINCDGEVNAEDLIRLAQALVGHFIMLCPGGGCWRCDPENHQPPTGHRFPGGSGTEGDPFWVSTPEDLNAVRYHLDAHFLQINDIDMGFHTTSPGGLFYNGGAGWEPIGTFESDINWFDDVFSGTYDGGGYVISGLTIDRTSTRQQLLVGLFAYIYGGEVRNLGMVGGSVRGSSTGGTDSRVIAGAISGYLVGGRLSNSFNTGAVTAENEPYIGSRVFAGGLIGRVHASKITNIYNKGSVSAIVGIGSSAFAGGISGAATSEDANNVSRISNALNKGTIYASNPARVSYAGGITGYMYSGSIIDSCNKGYVEAFTAAGGIIGSARAVEVTNLSNTGRISGGIPHLIGEIFGSFR